MSIIIPAYNAEQSIQRALTSLLAISTKHRPSVEILIIDDGSTDLTALYSNQFCNQHQDFYQCSITSQTNRGAAAARNTGLSQCQGIWVFFLDADDELLIDPILHINESDSISCFGFQLQYQREQKTVAKVLPKRVTKSSHLDILTASNPFQPSSLLFRYECIDHPFREGIACVEDWLFWLQNPRIFEAMKPDPESISARIHMHDGNISRQFSKAGQNRENVAKLIKEIMQDQLTRLQSNNLQLQQEIGRLQQGQLCRLMGFVYWPCSPSLYFKFMIYFLAYLTGIRATRYGD